MRNDLKITDAAHTAVPKCPSCAAKDARIAALEKIDRFQEIEKRAGDAKLIAAFIRSERCPGEIDDPFISYQDAKMSKGKLCEIIAKSLSKWLVGKEEGK